MTAIASHLSAAELEARYKAAADPTAKSHFHAVWLLSLDYTAEKWRNSSHFRCDGSGCSSNAITSRDRTVWATGGKATARRPRS